MYSVQQLAKYNAVFAVNCIQTRSTISVCELYFVLVSSWFCHNLNPFKSNCKYFISSLRSKHEFWIESLQFILNHEMCLNYNLNSNRDWDLPITDCAMCMYTCFCNFFRLCCAGFQVALECMCCMDAATCPSFFHLCASNYHGYGCFFSMSCTAIYWVECTHEVLHSIHENS